MCNQGTATHGNLFFFCELPLEESLSKKLLDINANDECQKGLFARSMKSVLLENSHCVMIMNCEGQNSPGVV